MTSGLTKYIRHKRKLHDERQGKSFGNGQLSARVVAEGRSGIRRIFIRDFQVISDGSPAGAGFDLGPAPGELLIGAVAACLNHGYLIQAALLDIEIDTLEVVAKATSKPGQIGTGLKEPVDLDLRYTARIASPASDEELENLRQKVELNSFVYNVVTRGASIAGRLERIEA
ncbi:MAG: OsmC family protein [Rhizobium sp.]